jgi:hypothetical protein
LLANLPCHIKSSPPMTLLAHLAFAVPPSRPTALPPHAELLQESEVVELAPALGKQSVGKSENVNSR